MRFLTCLFIAAAVFLQSTKAAVPPLTTDIHLKNGCLLVATEAASKLRRYASWVEILHFDVYCGGRWLSGHAVTVWTPQTTSAVLIYDQWLINGSLETREHSHDAAEIALVLQHLRPKYTFRNAHFIK